MAKTLAKLTIGLAVLATETWFGIRPAELMVMLPGAPSIASEEMLTGTATIARWKNAFRT